jgi:hypothetical protein
MRADFIAAAHKFQFSIKVDAECAINIHVRSERDNANMRQFDTGAHMFA